MLGKNCASCEARRHIMFTEGRPGMTELVILGIAFTTVLIAWRFTQ